jgi:hypothetical protein
MRPLTFRSKLFLGCAVAVAVLAGVIVAVWPGEPIYEGKSLSYWLDRLPDSFVSSPVPPPLGTAFQSAESDTAERAVKELGARCLPTLVRRLKMKETRITKLEYQLRRQAAKFHLMRPMFIGSDLYKWERKRGQAAAAFLLLGDTAKPVLPNVIQIAKTDTDPEVRAIALEVVWHMSPVDWAQITGKTNSLSEAVRRYEAQSTNSLSKPPRQTGTF